NVSLYSANGKIVQSDDPADGVSSEVLGAADLQLDALTGIRLLFLSVDSLTGLNRGSGNIDLTEVAAGGNLRIDGLTQASAVESGFIRVLAEAGNIDVSNV